MPITGPASYLPTINQFLSHWGDVNTTLGGGAANELKVGLEPAPGSPPPAPGSPPPSIDRTGLSLLRDRLQAQRIVVDDASIDLTLKREEVKDRKTALLARFNQFSALVQGRFPGKAYARSLPRAPGISDGGESFAAALQRASALWLKINTALGLAPLVLGQNNLTDPPYIQATFASELGALRTALAAVTSLEQTLNTEIEERNDIQDDVRPILRDYRKTVEGRFAGPHALVDSLPRFSPLPGNKPAAPVITSAEYEEATQEAVIAFTPSSTSAVVRHELHVSPTAEFDPDLATIDATLAAGQPSVFRTTSHLGLPGAIMSAVVVAITADDQEAASDPVSIQRPAAPPAP